MIIVVEGPNNVGKTTFINTLLDVLPNYKVEHTSNITPNTYDYYKMCLKMDNIIYDRLHVGEMIYPLIYKRKCNLSDKEFSKLLNNKNVIYVFIDADIEFIIKSCTNKGEDFNLDTVYKEKLAFDKYYKLVKSLKSKVVRVHNHLVPEYKDNTYTDAIDTILHLTGDNNG